MQKGQILTKRINLLRASIRRDAKKEILLKEASDVKASCIGWLRAKIEKMPMRTDDDFNDRRNGCRENIVILSALGDMEILEWFRSNMSKQVRIGPIISGLTSC